MYIIYKRPIILHIILISLGLEIFIGDILFNYTNMEYLLHLFTFSATLITPISDWIEYSGAEIGVISVAENDKR